MERNENMKNKYKTRETSINTVKQFFKDSSSDIITLEEAFKSWGRDLQKIDDNKAWLSNKMTSLKYHNLVVPIYSIINNKRVLSKIQLTLEGKKAIGRIGENIITDTLRSSPDQDSRTEITLDDILRVIPKLKKENPDFNVTFSVTPKE
jgi:hypothetical protein